MHIVTPIYINPFKFCIFSGTMRMMLCYIYTHTSQIQTFITNNTMSQLDLSGFRKRKRGEKVFKFKVFGARGYPAGSNGSFHDNVRALLEFGQLETNTMSSWSFQLEARRHPLLLFVVEEPALDFSCRHCRYIGWGHHMICNKSYHFVLPSDDYAKTNAIDLHRDTHILHAVLHSNGFGHLLCINASALPGYQIMDFWDRLCSGLGAREVSLRDSAKKKGMELRLLHGVAYGRPWFGQWDYIFKRGSYGVDQEMYQNAIKTIQNIPLTLIAQQFGLGSEIQVILWRYQQLSSHSLTTLGDLFHFMMELKSRVSEESSSGSGSYPAIMSDASCRWSPKRVEKAIHVVVEALKRAEFQWVSRQHVRDVARAYIGDTGLLDFVLKSLGNHMVGKYLVRRCLNPVTKVLEYCLEDVSRTFSKQDAKLRPQHKITWAQLINDLLCVYSNILVDPKSGAFAALPVASRVILDAKHLAKDYHGEATAADEANKKKIYCRVILQHNGVEEAATPYHCFLVRNGATFDELRRQVEKTFGETYLALRNTAAESIRNMSPQGSDAVFKTVRPGSKIAFVCVCECEHQTPEPTVVNCVCGTRDDDGERMVSCDLCRASHHTRCVRVPDHHAVPDIFLCTGCEQDILRIRCYATSTPI
ncbi:PHD finger protein MALE STERILITY 1-like [Salvia miltiorrhiza]|uniref:PHD finger protein MALE STERILITY 1-like n=1 Tax=Salvia miltiorrhiza TaxID=226208 RepID=UPI0025AB66AF|nr:PHD finger protein MALE STERILITY 1-like [Salvia miltiorrhiza]